MTPELAEQPADQLITLADVEAARELLHGVVRVTPMEPCRPLTARIGGPAWLKCENLQRAGSYKVRGAYVRISRLTERERARGVVAASAGNHAQGVALAAGLCDTKATVFMPVGAPLPKVAATKGYGATVEFAGATVDEAIVAAQEFAGNTGAIFIHPFDHPDVIAGQGTVALEILEQCPEVDTIITAIGGGGLISGMAVAAKALRPDIQIIGVQAEGAASVPMSLQAGAPVRVKQMSTIADGIAVGKCGDLTFSHINKLVDEVVTVTDEEIARALLMLLERGKLVAEPAGCAGVAALMAGAASVRTPVVAVISGGNIDPLLMLRVMERGLSAAGRYLHVTVRATDRPGSLADLLTLIASHRANILDVSHERRTPRLHLGEVEIVLSIETRGADHSEELINSLRESGYAVIPGSPWN